MSDHARRGTKAAVPLFCLFFLLCGFSPAVAETRPETVTLAQAIRAALQDGLDAKIAGLTIEETAEMLGVSPATVKREWALARAWLHREISGGP